MRAQLRLAVSIAALWLGGAQAGPRQAPHPDLGGLWTSTSLTELERPKAFTTLTVSDAEAAAYARHRPDDFRNTDIDDIGGRQSEAGYWDPGSALARIGGKARTSWIVEPADGRLPYRPEGRRIAQARAAEVLSARDNPEQRTASERCLTGGYSSTGPPMLNAPYGGLYQIVQTPGEVAIAMELNHDVRVIRLGARGHAPARVRPWMGDSIGHWEGATLVVETTNFNPGDAFRPPIGLYVSPEARVTERFRREGADRLLYDFTVEDAATYTRPWRGQMVFQTAKGPIYEYACHEGNYALPGILAGARREEADARAAGK